MYCIFIEETDVWGAPKLVPPPPASPMALQKSRSFSKQRKGKNQQQQNVAGRLRRHLSASGDLLDNTKINSKIRSGLLRVSNFASMLCVLDCTILPVVTIALPLLGLALSPDKMEWIHEIGHEIAIQFVLPVGCFAAMMNYGSHRRPLLTAPAMVGLMMIYMANEHDGPVHSRLPHELVHVLHCSEVFHRLFNVGGCILLLGSNYVSHRAAKGPDAICC